MEAKQWFDTLPRQRSGFVLGGGGSKGCYEVGVWQALVRSGIQFDCVAGTSIGALVGAMYVQGSLSEMVRFVKTMTPSDIAEDLFAIPETLGAMMAERKEIGRFLEKYILSRKGMDISPLKQVIASMFQYEKFAASPVDFACMTFNVTRRRPEAYFKAWMNEYNAQEIILASASCYPAFPVMEMNGQSYIDGGYWDNVPVDLALKMGARRILAVDVQGPGVILPVDPEVDVFWMKPLLPLGNFLDFTSSVGTHALIAGNLETRKLLGQLCGLFYSFPIEQKSDLAFWDGVMDFQFNLHHVEISDTILERTVRWSTGCSESDLLKALLRDHTRGLLVECLAYVVGLDAWRIWSVAEFRCRLKERLKELDRQTSSPFALLDAWRKRELDNVRTLCLAHWLLKNRDNPLWMTQLQAMAGPHPAEVALAWAWLFLEQ